MSYLWFTLLGAYVSMRSAMKNAFKTAARVFKYASLAFVVLYCGYIVLGDYVFIKQISGVSDFNLFMETQLMYLLVLYIAFILCYWLTAVILIFLYVKIYSLVKNVIKGMHN